MKGKKKKTPLTNSRYPKTENNTSKNRKQNIIWLNLPYNNKNKISKIFFKLIDKNFPKSSKLLKIINKKTIS